MRAALALLLAAGAVAAHAAGRQPAPDTPLPPVPTPEERRIIRKGEGGERRLEIARAIEAAMLTPGAPVDVEHYTLDINVSLLPNRVAGSVRIQARSLQDGLTALDVDLYDEMGATAVLAGATPLVFTHASDRVQITLDRAYDDGELIDVIISYGGTPPSTVFGAFSFQTHAGQPIISSLSEPTYAPMWWPCLDDPADKAIVDMNLTVPAPLVGVSNGLLINTISNPDSTITYEWRSSYPISTYLVSVAISNYQTWTDWYTPVTGGPVMPVQNWVYPSPMRSRTST
jgi:aminopeptidase N